MRVALDRERILSLFALLDDELAARGVVGELYLVGGAVMCLALDARASTLDVDAAFRPTAEVRAAATAVARRAGVAPDWLNDAVKGFLGERAAWTAFLERPHLKVYVAQPQYLLALKAAAVRIGEGFHDIDDLRFLLRYLNIERVDEAVATILEYLPEASLPAKTRYLLAELLPGTSDAEAGD